MKYNITIFRIEEDDPTYVGLVLRNNSDLDFKLWQGAHNPRAPIDERYDLKKDYLREIESVGNEDLTPFAVGTTSIDDYFFDFVSFTKGDYISIDWYMSSQSDGKIQVIYPNDTESAQLFAQRYELEMLEGNIKPTKDKGIPLGFGLSSIPQSFSGKR